MTSQASRPANGTCVKCTHHEVEMRSAKAELRRVARAADRNEDPTRVAYFREQIAAKKAAIRKRREWTEDHESECGALGTHPTKADI